MKVAGCPEILFSLLAFVFCCPASLLSQSCDQTPHASPAGKSGLRASSETKRGLHGTLNVDRGYYGDLRLETLTFRLMNDSDQVLDSATASWVLVIDDQEVPDRGGQLWAGPQPTGGYGTVKSGGTFQFGKALPIREYFPEPRDYKIYWRAAAFRSNVVTVRGGVQP
jgi:hypothetical protein